MTHSLIPSNSTWLSEKRSWRLLGCWASLRELWSNSVLVTRARSVETSVLVGLMWDYFVLMSVAYVKYHRPASTCAYLHWGTLPFFFYNPLHFFLGCHQVDWNVVERFYVALLLHQVWSGAGIWEASATFHVHRGFTQQTLTAAAAFASSVYHFCQVCILVLVLAVYWR